MEVHRSIFGIWVTDRQFPFDSYLNTLYALTGSSWGNFMPPMPLA